MKLRLLLFGALLFGFGIWGCERELPQELKVQQFVTFVEPVTKAEMKAPATWLRQIVPGKSAFFVSSEGVAKRFLQYEAEGAAGARVGMVFFQMSTTATLQSYLDSVRVFEDPSLYSEVQQTTIGGKPAYWWSYSAEYPDGEFYGEQYVATADSQIVTVLQLESFGGVLETVRPIFDTAIASAKLGVAPKIEPVKVDTVIVEREPFKPAAKMKAYASDYFTIQVPENFLAKVQNKQNVLFSVKFVGDGGPSDCTVEIDVFEAKNVSKLDKVIEDNKSAYEQAGFRITAVKTATVAGQPAKYFEYRYGKNIAGRAYFVLVNERLYRITLNWYIPEKDIYLPTFTKMVRSFQIK